MIREIGKKYNPNEKTEGTGGISKNKDAEKPIPLFPRNTQELIECSDWQAHIKSLEDIDSSQKIVDLYDQLAKIRFQTERDQWKWEDRRFTPQDVFDQFAETLICKVARTDSGFNKLKSALQKRELGDIFHVERHRDSIDEYDGFRSLIIREMFQANPKEAVRFFRPYLKKLRQWEDQTYAIREDLYGKVEGTNNYYEEIPPNYDEHGFETADTVKEGLRISKNTLESSQKMLQGLEKNPEKNKRQITTLYKNIAQQKQRILELEEKLKNKDFYKPSPYEELIKQSSFESGDFEMFTFSVNQILEGLAEKAQEGEAGKPDVDMLIDYLKNDDFVVSHIDQLVSCFEKIDINYSVDKLLEILREPASNERSEAFLHKITTNILYRLEFGRIGISAEGVNYLKRLYDLGEYNNPDYFAHRLTRDGDIGIFDENRVLMRYFNLGDLSTDESRIKAKALLFTYRTLFVPQADETAEQRRKREKILGEFKKKYFDFFDDRFFQNTGVAFNNLSFLEQGKFLQFIEHADDETKGDAYQFVQKYGENGLRAFLSLEYGEEYGDVLLSLDNSEYINSQEVQSILGEYNTLNHHALAIAKKMRRSALFETVDLPEEISDLFVEQFSEAILRRAKDILNTAQAIAKNGKAQTEFYGKRVIECDNPQEIIQGLRIYSNILEKLECLIDPNDDTNRFEIKLTEIDQNQIPEIYDFEIIPKNGEKSSYLTIQLREQGAPPDQHNATMEFNGEARINILTHHKKIGKKLTEKSRQKAFSTRLDLEGIIRLDGEIIANDPTKGKELSWDVGFIEDQKSSLPGDVISRVMAIGNALGEARKGRLKTGYPEFYHNRESFVEKLGQPDVFAKIVRFIRRQIEDHYEVPSEKKVLQAA